MLSSSLRALQTKWPLADGGSELCVETQNWGTTRSSRSAVASSWYFSLATPLTDGGLIHVRSGQRCSTSRKSPWKRLAHSRSSNARSAWSVLLDVTGRVL